MVCTGSCWFVCCSWICQLLSSLKKNNVQVSHWPEAVDYMHFPFRLYWKWLKGHNHNSFRLMQNILKQAYPFTTLDFNKRIYLFIYFLYELITNHLVRTEWHESTNSPGQSRSLQGEDGVWDHVAVSDPVFEAVGVPVLFAAQVDEEVRGSGSVLWGHIPHDTEGITGHLTDLNVAGSWKRGVHFCRLSLEMDINVHSWTRWTAMSELEMGKIYTAAENTTDVHISVKLSSHLGICVPAFYLLP